MAEQWVTHVQQHGTIPALLQSTHDFPRITL